MNNDDFDVMELYMADRYPQNETYAQYLKRIWPDGWAMNDNRWEGFQKWIWEVMDS